MEERLYGSFKEFYYSPETKDRDIRDKIIELLMEIPSEDCIPEWNTLQIIFHDYLDGIDPVGPSTVTIKYKGTQYK